MTDAEVYNINVSRLARWEKLLTREHATPVVLLGIGHDDRSGDRVVLTLEDMPTTELILFVDSIRHELKRQRRPK